MKLTMELSKRNTERLKKALEATDEKAVRAIVGDCTYDHYKDTSVFVFEIGKQSLCFKNDLGENCTIYVAIGVENGPFHSNNPKARLAIYYGTENGYEITREIQFDKIFDEIVLKEGTLSELRLKIKLAE